MAGNTLDVARIEDASIKHQTEVRVVTGAVVVTVDGMDGGGPNHLMIASTSEPAERALGGGAEFVDVIHLHHPLEVVAPAYGGGTFTMNLYERWDGNPYKQAGFENADEYIDIINHAVFGVTIIVLKPNGERRYQKLRGCRVTGPIMPSGTISRATRTRTMAVPCAYTRQEFSPKNAGGLAGVIA